MADYKQDYSDTSQKYVSNVINSELETKRYNNSKTRENKWNINWNKNKVNINVIIDHYINVKSPSFKRYKKGVKYIYEDDRNCIICDMASGYLRILNKETFLYYDNKGKLSSNKNTTHFKIKKREEM